MSEKFIYWGTLVIGWLLLPVAMVFVAWQIAVRFVDSVIENKEQ